MSEMHPYRGESVSNRDGCLHNHFQDGQLGQLVIFLLVGKPHLQASQVSPMCRRCVDVGGYAWLWLAKFGYVWALFGLCLGCVWLGLAMFGYVWLELAMFRAFVLLPSPRSGDCLLLIY